jgi:hypothetical protein
MRLIVHSKDGGGGNRYSEEGGIDCERVRNTGTWEPQVGIRINFEAFHNIAIKIF